MARVGSPPRMPLGPLLRTLCFSGWVPGDEPARSEPFAPRDRGDGVSFGCPVVTSVVTPLRHLWVGRVPCAVLWPGLCPHPMSSLPSCSGLHPSTELPPPAAVPPPHAPWLSMVNGDALVPTQLGCPWWPPPGTDPAGGGSGEGAGGHRPSAGVAVALTLFASLSLAPLSSSSPAPRPRPPAAGTTPAPRTALGTGHPQGWGRLGGACTLQAKETKQ